MSSHFGLSIRLPCKNVSASALSSLFFLSPFALPAQLTSTAINKVFQLSGTLTGRDTGMLVLWYPDTTGTWRRDTTNLIGGAFSFKGYVREPSYAHLIGSKRDGNYASFFLEKGDQTILLEEDKFDKIQMDGSPTQAAYAKLTKQTDLILRQIQRLSSQAKPLEASIKKKRKGASTNADEERLEKLHSRIADEEKNIAATEADFIRNNPTSFASPTVLLGLLSRRDLSFKVLKSLYEALGENLRKSRSGVLCLEAIEAKEKLTEGCLLANFESVDINGNPYSLSAHRGRYVLLEFWASWCVPCRKAFPEIKQVYLNYHPLGFDVVAISLDRDKAAWKDAIKKDSIDSWTHLLLDKSTQLFEPINLIPHSILLDKTGKIIWSSFDGNDKGWQEQLAKRIGKRP